MKHKTAELEGALLDAAVAKAEGWVRTRSAYGERPELWDTGGGFYRVSGEPGLPGDERWAPSTNWWHGGPILERERIELRFNGEGWAAGPHVEDWQVNCSAVPISSTPLIAAMRAFVASKVGDEVELP